jgi:RimJ/RimL family protein N-acetyltransferase
MVDAALAERIDHDLDETIGLLWSGYAHFARHGLGMCLMIGDEIASVAFACAVSKTMSNIGVATAEAHRQKGYATLVSRAFIEESLRRGLTPTWDCDEWNTASLATARRLGLTERAPFTELGLGPYPRCKPPLSEGIWGWQAGEAGVKVWSR